MDRLLVNRRAEAALFAKLWFLTNWREDADGTGAAQERMRAEGALAAVAAVAALPRAEFAAWRARFSDESGEAPPVVSLPATGVIDELRIDAHLRDLVAGLGAARQALSRGERGGASELRERFDDTLEALAGAGVLAEQDVVAWRDRANAELGLPSEAEQEARAAGSQCSAIELVRVVPGAEPVDGLWVLWAELYADGVVLRYRLEAAVERDPGGGPGAPPWQAGFWEQTRRADLLELTDDVGTRYFPGGGGSCGDDEAPNLFVSAGSLSFAPAPPAEATVLYVMDGERRLSIALHGAGE